MISIATAAGYNFPWIIYKDLVKGEQLKVNSYNESLYWIEINSDIYNTLFKRSEENFTLREYIRPYLSKDKTFSIFKFGDLKPFFLHTAVFLRKTITSRSNPVA